MPDNEFISRFLMARVNTCQTAVSVLMHHRLNSYRPMCGKLAKIKCLQFFRLDQCLKLSHANRIVNVRKDFTFTSYDLVSFDWHILFPIKNTPIYYGNFSHDFIDTYSFADFVIWEGAGDVRKKFDANKKKTTSTKFLISAFTPQ